MRKKLLICLGTALSLAAVSSGAFAATAVTVTALNLRAGPATGYPVVATMPTASLVVSQGCLADLSWCDVSSNGQHGWVSSSYIRIIYQQQPVVVTASSAPIIGVRVVAFDYGYWQRYYVGRSWYTNWSVYAPLRRVTVARAPVQTIHRGATGCGRHGCVHVGRTYGPQPRVDRVTVIH